MTPWVDPKKRHADLDCIESVDIFAVFPPGSAITRDSFSEKALRPLLRQAVVAACAAVETFVADRVMERFTQALDGENPPERLLALPMTVGDWLAIETYERRRWGLRKVVEAEVRRRVASASPGQIGIAFSLVGEKDLWSRVDAHRGVKKGIGRGPGKNLRTAKSHRARGRPQRTRSSHDRCRRSASGPRFRA